ncbi:hypothetical protein [Sulfurisphaera tokodaii]|uniref:Uncharacterized protein n=2 Tax=Sulfurisphaera tokodaii TaxID=111955 RepID=F9VN29_SULTO|nr:hypothetical protein [Sulfurisphaera tokodaii]BAK54326.1 hypothetical protein STK_05420 [Sulfurisphaera tokodaii str. 7]HII74760.1 hypothetical protein [Sulfurisphaera tokodaii]
MYELISEYLKYPPYEILPILELRIPCSTQCISNSKFKQLLEIEEFRSQLEVVDSLKDLINYKIENLVDEISVRISNKKNLDINSLTYSVYKIIEFGGDYQIGYDNIVFEDKKIFAGSFNEIMRLNKEIEKILTDKDVRSLCDEIKYLVESLWEHFDKNIRRSLNESQSRT